MAQGKDNVERKLSPTYDDTLPKDHAQTLYLWIQDGWQTEKSVIAEAKGKAADNPTLFAFLPAQHKTELTNAIVALEAARTTLQKKGSPSTEEGRDAQRSMESRQRTAEKDLAELLEQFFGAVRVFQAGGHEAQDGNDLHDRINRAAKSSAIRLYSQFDAADHDQWSKVLDEARKGNLDALKAVGAQPGGRQASGLPQAVDLHWTRQEGAPRFATTSKHRPSAGRATPSTVRCTPCWLAAT